jgi:putative peptidoglycan lipid II flippase
MPQPQPDVRAAAGSGRAQIVRAATIVMTAFIASRILGVVRDMVITYYFGIDSLEAEAYALAIRLPDTIFYILAGGALGSAFIPTFSAYFVRDDPEGGWRLFSAIINLVTIVSGVVAAVTAVFAPQLIAYSLPGLVSQNPELLELTVRLTRVMLISPVIFGVSGVIMGALNARQHFLLPSLAPVIYNLGIIAGAVIWAPDVMGLAIGTIVGATGHLLIQIPGVWQQQGRYLPLLTWRDSGVQQVLRLMGPRILGLSFGQLNHLITPLLAQAMVAGSIPALNFGWRIMIMPHGILGQALGIAAFPTFATLAAQSALAEMRRILADTLRLIFFLGLPITVLMSLLRRPIVSLLFGRGDCDAACVEFVAWALLFYTVGLIALTGLEVISRAFYALGDTITPVAAGVIQLIAMILLSLWLSYGLFPLFGWLPLGGVALAASLANLLEMGLLLWWLRGRLGGVDGRYLGRGLVRMVIAASLMALSSGLLQQALTVPPLWELMYISLLGGTVYLLVSFWLNVTELQHLLFYGRQRFRLPRP